MASAGRGRTAAATPARRGPAKGNNGVGNGVDPPPPGKGAPVNDGAGTGPGNPGRRGRK